MRQRGRQRAEARLPLLEPLEEGQACPLVNEIIPRTVRSAVKGQQDHLPHDWLPSVALRGDTHSKGPGKPLPGEGEGAVLWSGFLGVSRAWRDSAGRDVGCDAGNAKVVGAAYVEPQDSGTEGKHPPRARQQAAPSTASTPHPRHPPHGARTVSMGRSGDCSGKRFAPTRPSARTSPCGGATRQSPGAAPAPANQSLDLSLRRTHPPATWTSGKNLRGRMQRPRPHRRPCDPARTSWQAAVLCGAGCCVRLLSSWGSPDAATRHTRLPRSEARAGRPEGKHPRCTEERLEPVRTAGPVCWGRTRSHAGRCFPGSTLVPSTRG